MITQWEYRIESLGDFVTEDTEVLLERLGKDGWELAGIGPLSRHTSDSVLYLRRALDNNCLKPK